MTSNVKISALAAASALDGTEVLPVVQAGSTVKATVNQIKTAAQTDVIMSVSAWGAVGDGTTDDTAALQAALSAGGTVFLTPGNTYKITASILTTASRLHIIGYGATIKATSGMSSYGVVVNADYFSCEGVTFDASAAPSLSSLLFVAGNNSKVRDCRFVGGVYNPRLPGTIPGPYYHLYVGGYGGYSMLTDIHMSGLTIEGGNNGIVVQGGKRVFLTDSTAVGCASFGCIIGGGLSVQDVHVDGFTALSCGLYGFSNSTQFGAAGVEPAPMRNWSITASASFCGWRSALDGSYGSIGSGKYGFDITDGGLDGLAIKAQARDCCAGGMESKAVYSTGYDSTLTTSASTASGSVLPFSSTSTVYVGMAVAGTNIPADTYVASKTSTSVTLTRAITGTVSSGASIAFTVGISPQGHKNVSIDMQYMTSLATPDHSAQGVLLVLEDSVSDQFFGEKQRVRVMATTKQATAWRSNIYKVPYEIVASDGSLWLCFGTTAAGVGGVTGQTAPASGKYVSRATNASTSSGAVLSFASVTDIAAGQAVFGANIPDGTTVSSVDGGAKIVTLSQNVTSTGVANGATVIFGTLANDGSLYWLCLGTDYSASTSNNNQALTINCVSYIYGDVVSIGNGYGAYFNSTRAAASNAIDNVTLTARIIGARYGVFFGGSGTVTNVKLTGSDLSAESGVYFGGGTTDVSLVGCNVSGNAAIYFSSGTNTVSVVGGKFTSTANSAALYLAGGTNTITLNGDPLFYATTGRSLYGTGGTHTLAIAGSATFDGGVNGAAPCDFNTGTYTVTWGNATIVNRNGSNQQSGYRNTGAATLTTYGGPFRRDLTTAPSGTTKGNVGEHMVLAAPTSTVWGYVCTAADFVTPAFTWKAKSLA